MPSGLVVATEPWITRNGRERRHIERAPRFLMILGRSTGEFIRGTDFLFPCVLTLCKAAESLLRQCGREPLGREEFVFMSDQGYQFLFFGRLAGDDPPLFLFLEGQPESREVFPTFSAWLTRCVADELVEN